MPKYTHLPAVKGKELIKLLQKDGWVVHGHVTHGVSLRKQFADRVRVTLVQDTGAALPDGTLGAILGPKQTSLGKRGLLDLLNRFGI